MSFGDLVLGPAYREWGRPAVLTVAAVAHPITAIDLTNRTVAGLAETIDPRAAIRAADLTILGLTSAQLDDATLVLNGKNWRVTAWQPQPSPEGEADGEYVLLLEGT